MEQRRPRLGILGGTFDPIHLGHLVAASAVHDQLELDRVLLTPTAMQPFKAGERTTPASHRRAMCAIAADGDPRFDVSDVDLERGGVTYTVDTLADIAAQHPDAELYFITGADALARLEDWKDVDRLMTLATFVGVTRPGHSFVKIDRPHILVEAPALAISSTDVRQRVRAGRSIRYLVPDGVADYIAQHGLYHGGLDD